MIRYDAMVRLAILGKTSQLTPTLAGRNKKRTLQLDFQGLEK
jgi:hypothetical protein